MAWTAPLTWTGVPTATQFNQQIRDNLQVLLGPMQSASWQKWVPAVRFTALDFGGSVSLTGSAGGALRIPAWSFGAASDQLVATSLHFPIAGFPIFTFYYTNTADTGNILIRPALKKVAAGVQVDDAWDLSINNFTPAAATTTDALVTASVSSTSFYVTPGLYRVGVGRVGTSGADTAANSTLFLGLHIAVNLE